MLKYLKHLITEDDRREMTCLTIFRETNTKKPEFFSSITNQNIILKLNPDKLPKSSVDNQYKYLKYSLS